MGNKATKSKSPQKAGKDEKSPRPHSQGNSKRANKKGTHDLVLKYLTIGDQGVGKTSLVIRYVRDEFVEAGTLSDPLREDHLDTTVDHDGTKIQLRIFDTNGQEGFRTITSTYYRGSHLVFICFDVSFRQSFEALSTWIQEVDRYAGKQILRVIVGCKNDVKEREVTVTEAKEFADHVGFEYFETSAATKDGVVECFRKGTDLVFKAIEEGDLIIDSEETL